MSTPLLNPGGAMPQEKALQLKIQREAKPPRLWRWLICDGEQERPIQFSAPRFRSSEEAWEAGQKALTERPRRR
jgi:hypothetical protein